MIYSFITVYFILISFKVCKRKAENSHTIFFYFLFIDDDDDDYDEMFGIFSQENKKTRKQINFNKII